MTSSRVLNLPCTVTVEHTWESLEAHVELADGIQPGLGDRITVHGSAIKIPFGEKIVVQRDATLRRAGPLTKAWMKVQQFFELTELYEVSFSTEMLK